MNQRLVFQNVGCGRPSKTTFRQCFCIGREDLGKEISAWDNKLEVKKDEAF